MNIRNETDRAKLIEQGWIWVVVEPRNPRGQVYSKHRTYAAAQRAAKGLERMPVDLHDAHMF